MPKGPQSRASHYIVDCFYPDVNGPGGFRKESFALVASSDKEAIHEAIYGIRGVSRIASTFGPLGSAAIRSFTGHSMPKEPQGQKRPADVIGNAVHMS